MLARLFILMLSLTSSSSLWAITCYYTLVKDSCWTKYNVSVDVMDAITNTVLTTVIIPTGKSWMRQPFSCKPAQKLFYKARFTPIIWESEKDAVYSATNYWSLPAAVKSGDSAWNVAVCYPADFSRVPLPPDATNHCACDLSGIPPIPPAKAN